MFSLKNLFLIDKFTTGKRETWNFQTFSFFFLSLFHDLLNWCGNFWRWNIKTFWRSCFWVGASNCRWLRDILLLVGTCDYFKVFSAIFNTVTDHVSTMRIFSSFFWWKIILCTFPMESSIAFSFWKIIFTILLILVMV